MSFADKLAPMAKADEPQVPTSQLQNMDIHSNVATPGKCRLVQATRNRLLSRFISDITRPSSPVPSALPKSTLPSKKHKVAVVGSGSFGTALAKIAAKNVASRPDEFHSEVRMWVREKIVSSPNPCCTAKTKGKTES
jgi:hypothetical protein